MTQEEKAKRYDETLERAKLSRLQLLDIGEEATEIEYIFPELKESEDEKIRKVLLNDFKNNCSEYYCEGVNRDMIIAWLEKQGEQKPADNLEPKFKVGDWITDGCVGGQITGIEDNYLCYKIADFVEGISTSIPFTLQDNYHLWTIQDAKDGDILWHSDTASNGIFIFKEIRHDGKVLCYCDYDSEDHFCTGEYHTCCWSHSKYIKPATKEQRNHLFEKMHEAGYKWDAEKKELKRIDVELTDFEKSLKHIMIETLECGDTRNLKADAEMLLRLAQKPIVWSEEDEHRSEDTIYFLNTAKSHYESTVKIEACVDWLKSLKQRKGGTQ